ncbi:MAG: hypothetical protein MUF04_05110, partial [Akkermansiaceae bacterium]|nr:hypothetical protein [Akkermansiaceae bacterium]
MHTCSITPQNATTQRSLLPPVIRRRFLNHRLGPGNPRFDRAPDFLQANPDKPPDEPFFVGQDALCSALAAGWLDLGAIAAGGSGSEAPFRDLIIDFQWVMTLLSKKFLSCVILFDNFAGTPLPYRPNWNAHVARFLDKHPTSTTMSNQPTSVTSLMTETRTFPPSDEVVKG